MQPKADLLRLTDKEQQIKPTNMKAKNWVMALIMALTSTSIAVAQEGETTKEGIPVIDEIVTDNNTDNDASTTTKTTTKVGTWHITTYVNDSLSTDNTIDITEEILDDMPDFVKGLVGLSGIGLASGTVLLVLVILLCIFGLPLILLFILLLLIFRRRKTNAPVNTATATETQDASTTDRTLFNKGVKNICLGIGLAIFLGIWMGDFGVGIGILIVCIGIGELLVDYFARK